MADRTSGERQRLQRGGLQDAQVLPGLPERFGALQDARAFADDFFATWNVQRLHTACDFVPSAEYEAAYWAEQQVAEAA